MDNSWINPFGIDYSQILALSIYIDNRLYLRTLSIGFVISHQPNYGNVPFSVVITPQISLWKLWWGCTNGNKNSRKDRFNFHSDIGLSIVVFVTLQYGDMAYQMFSDSWSRLLGPAHFLGSQAFTQTEKNRGQFSFGVFSWYCRDDWMITM